MKHFKYRIKPKCLFFSTPHSSNNKKKGFGVAMKSVFFFPQILQVMYLIIFAFVYEHQ